MTKEFLPHKLTLKLKEVGFNEPCMGYYDCERDLKLVPNKSKFLECEYAAPLYQEVFRWFREKYGVYFHQKKFDENKWWVEWGEWRSPVFETYDELELKCVKKLIKIAKL